MGRGAVAGWVLIVASAGGAQAQDNAAAAAPAAAAEKKVCRSETPTGSMMARRICRTRAEWAALAAADRTNVDHLRDRVTTTAGNPVGN